MKTTELVKGLNIPISGHPSKEIRAGNPVNSVAIIGDDYPGMKPTMLVKVGDRVQTGQPVFSDKRNAGVIFTAPGCGLVDAINRGEKRKFESLVIRLDGDEAVQYFDPENSLESFDAAAIRDLLVQSGLWTLFRTRPYGKTPAIDSSPSSLFVTAMDTSPLAADVATIIDAYPKEYETGLTVVRRLIDVPIHYCTDKEELALSEQVEGIKYHRFTGPHPAGLASTHIHFIDPVHENKTVWQLGYQHVIAIGHFFLYGQIMTEQLVALCGSGVLNPTLVRTRIGASLAELLRRELSLDDLRVISGSVLSGRKAAGGYAYLGRFHQQISVIEDSSGRSIFNWLLPGKDRFSIRPVFASILEKNLKIPMNTALWGGRRAIYPLGTYDEVMPLDIIATSLLKAIAKCDTEKSKALGCLELIEEDLGLCGFVCPGKNEFGEDLREVLTAIERGD